MYWVQLVSIMGCTRKTPDEDLQQAYHADSRSLSLAGLQFLWLGKRGIRTTEEHTLEYFGNHWKERGS